ncbi:MAG TPA: VWA domain-containing protein [Thermoanaerobaculia bacterium]|nr:VWA domain-containing protein [Thermoanaerobaculia bacterium]
MKRRARFRPALSLLLLLTGLAVALPAAQDPEEGEEPESRGEDSFFEVIDVNVVNVDVYVTDKKGNPIHGLSKSDFEVYEDDKPMTITNFYAVREGRAAAEPAAEPGEKAPPALEARIPGELTVPEDQRLHLVVYIDNWNIQPHHRNRVFSSIREFLRTSLGPGDRVMLMTFDREPHVRHGFTSDGTTIASALFEIERLSANGSRQESERREVLRDIQEAEDPNWAITRARMYSESAHNDLQFSIDSIKNTVSSLGGLPGRKAILYVSDGLPLSPGEDLFHAIQEKFPAQSSAVLESRQYDVSRRFQEMIASANANRISFYTIDAGGLRVSTSISAENQTAISTGFVDSVHWNNIQSSIRMMAEDTGGIAIVNTNDPTKGLAKIAADFENYYSLGYSPAHSGDGRYHEIEVKVRNRDWVVRHRDGYRDKTTDARMSDGVMSSLFYNVESNPMGVTVDRGQESRRDDGYFVVPVEIKIPIGNLVLIPEGDNHVARVRVYIAAMDGESNLSEVRQAPVPIDVPSAELESALGKTWVFSLPVVMRKGPQRLAVGVRDDFGQTSSFAVRTMVIGGR